MRVGHTIVEKRERVESESERMVKRKKAKTRQVLSGVIFVAGVLVVGIMIWSGVAGVLSKKETPRDEVVRPVPTVDIIDEARVGVTNRMREYVALLEQDFAGLGYRVAKAVVPSGKSREIDIYLDGKDGYIKTNIDRDTAVSAEDADRMVRYLEEHDINEFRYIDVRIERKGYYAL